MARLRDTSLFADANLQGYWELDNGWTDSGPNGYTLTPQNSPTFGTAKYGTNAASFASASSQLAFRARASVVNLRIAGSQTWVCWVNQTTVTSYQAPMSLSNGDGTIDHGLLTSADGNIAYFNLPGLTTNTQVNGGAGALTTGLWYQLVGVYNSATTTLKIYINGVEKGSVTASGSVTDIATGNFTLGSNGAGTGNFMNGLVDDAAIFNRALTADEITTLYNETATIDNGSFYFM